MISENSADELQSKARSASIHIIPENTEGKNEIEPSGSYSTNKEDDIVTTRKAENKNDRVLTSGSSHCSHTILNLLGNSIKDLTVSLARATEMLLVERNCSRKLEWEITDLKIKLIETQNATKYNNPDYHQQPYYATMQTATHLSSDPDSNSDSDLDSSEKANEVKRKVLTQKHNKDNGKSIKKKKRGVHRNPRKTGVSEER